MHASGQGVTAKLVDSQSAREAHWYLHAEKLERELTEVRKLAKEQSRRIAENEAS